MPTQLSGYPENDASKASALKEITVTTLDNKSYLDTNAVVSTGDAANTARTTSTIVIPVQVVDSAGRVAKVDSTTTALKVIDYSHVEIHGGSSFEAFHSAASKNDGQTINLYFKTPNTTTWGHMFAKWSASGAAYFRIYEAPTITSNTGTNGQSIFNRNRNSATTSVMVDNATTPVANKYGTDVTKTGDGTIIHIDFAGAAKSQGGVGRNEEEFILKQNTAYLFEVESDAAGLTLALSLNWYEHING